MNDDVTSPIGSVTHVNNEYLTVKLSSFGAGRCFLMSGSDTACLV